MDSEGRVAGGRRSGPAVAAAAEARFRLLGVQIAGALAFAHSRGVAQELWSDRGEVRLYELRRSLWGFPLGGEEAP